MHLGIWYRVNVMQRFFFIVMIPGYVSVLVDILIVIRSSLTTTTHNYQLPMDALVAVVAMTTCFLIREIQNCILIVGAICGTISVQR